MAAYHVASLWVQICQAVATYESWPVMGNLPLLNNQQHQYELQHHRHSLLDA